MTGRFGEDGVEFLGVVCGEPNADTIIRMAEKKKDEKEIFVFDITIVFTEQYKVRIYIIC